MMKAGETGGDTFMSSLHDNHKDAVNNTQKNQPTIERSGTSQNKSGSTDGKFVSDSQPRLHIDGDISSTLSNEQKRGNDKQHGEQNDKSQKGVSKVKFYYSYSFELFIDEGNVSPEFAMKLVTVTHSPDLHSIINFDLHESSMDVTVRTYSHIDSIRCENGNLSVLLNKPNFEASDDAGVWINETDTELDKVPTREILWKVSDASAKREAFDAIAVCIIKQKIPDLNCNMTVYANHEVMVLDSTLYVKNTTLSYKTAEFKIVGKKVFACVDKIMTVTLIRFFKYSKIQRIVTIITSSVSVISLAFICISHIALPKLRNNHGLNLLALSATTLLVQATVLIENTPTGEACVLFAVCLHFLVLEMLTWMSIIGFDMARTFRKQRVTKKPS